jgi:hypothetical protein
MGVWTGGFRLLSSSAWSVALANAYFQHCIQALEVCGQLVLAQFAPLEGMPEVSARLVDRLQISWLTLAFRSVDRRRGPAALVRAHGLLLCIPLGD